MLYTYENKRYKESWSLTRRDRLNQVQVWTSKSPSALLFGYANRTKILDNLRSWLCHLDVDHIQPFWREAISQDETDAAEPIAKLFAQLDIRVILRLLIEEVRRSPRTDCSINNSKRRNYAH